MIIYLDLDGVLADFDKRADQLLGPEHTYLATKEDWDILRQKDPEFFLNLDLMPSARELWKYVKELVEGSSHDLKILTALPFRADWPEVKDHKRKWVRKHFCKDIEVLFGPFSRDKQKHCKPGDILIDDREDNINAWNEAGGIGVLYKDPKSTKLSKDL